MANILEFLRTVLVDGEARGRFRHDPPGYLKEGGFADLTGEDVAEAMHVLKRSLPESVATSLEPFGGVDDGADLPPTRPIGTESELDAAARVLGFAVARTDAANSTGWPATDPPSMAAPAAVAEPVAAWPEPAPAVEPVAPSTESWSAPVPITEPRAEPVIDDAVMETETDTETETGPPQWVQTAAVATGLDDLRDAAVDHPADDQPIDEPHVNEQDNNEQLDDRPNEDAPVHEPEAEADESEPDDPTGEPFGAALDAAVAEARQRHEEAMRLYTDTSGQTAHDLGQRLDTLIQQAQARAGAITAAAEAAAAQSKAEADAIRQRVDDEARAIIDQARREADEIRLGAQSDAEAARHDVEHRRAALREAEEQLRERLSGIDSLFRRVFDDDPAPTPAADPAGDP